MVENGLAGKRSDINIAYALHKARVFLHFLYTFFSESPFLKATLRGLATARPSTGFASHLLYFLDPGKGSKSCPTDFGERPL